MAVKKPGALAYAPYRLASCCLYRSRRASEYPGDLFNTQPGHLTKQESLTLAFGKPHYEIKNYILAVLQCLGVGCR